MMGLLHGHDFGKEVSVAESESGSADRAHDVSAGENTDISSCFLLWIASLASV
jgi:hypothetical protein